MFTKLAKILLKAGATAAAIAAICSADVKFQLSVLMRKQILMIDGGGSLYESGEEIMPNRNHVRIRERRDALAARCPRCGGGPFTRVELTNHELSCSLRCPSPNCPFITTVPALALEHDAQCENGQAFIESLANGRAWVHREFYKLRSLNAYSLFNTFLTTLFCFC